MRPLTRAKLDALDLLDRVRGRRDPLVPPRRLNFVGPGDFVATGEEFFALFERAGLEPGDDVLDVGSGIGRMARPLAGRLEGRYEGFDIIRGGVDWCARAITPRHPNFTFTHVDVHNGEYNPSGKLAADAFRFPYDDASFDFALLTSVFTHLLPPELRHYLAELGRVLRPGGTVFATYFLLEEGGPTAGPAHDFRFERDGYRTLDDATPEQGVAYPVDTIRAWHEAAGIPVADVWPGTWPGRPGATLQDVTISRRA
jgi:ubiquinone/menaquinone biosynthesis C-methylase UbiE